MIPESPVEMTMCELLSWIVLGGSIGGVAAMLIKVKVVKDGMLLDTVSVRLRTLLGLAVVSSFIGSAAALAAQWLLIGINKFESTTDVKNTIFILAISVVAGYGARQILPMLTRRFEKELEDVKVDLIEKVEDVEEELQETKKEAYVVTKGVTSLTPGTPEFEIHKSRSEMESYLKSHPTARRVAIVLARSFRAENALGKAIAVLEKFLKAKADLQQFDNDYADVLYNLACYKTLLSVQTGDVKYKEQAYEALKKSVEISPTNKMDAQTDNDFQSLWNEDRFIALGTTN